MIYVGFKRTFGIDFGSIGPVYILMALSNMLWVVVLGCDFFVQDITFVPSYCHVS